MKIISAILLLSISTLLVACNQSENEQKPSDGKASQTIEGRWKLQKEENAATREKGVLYEDQPTYVILHIQKNGYFILYDTFIDPSWKKKGLPLINQRSKGQWEVKGKELTLYHHDTDTSYTEKLQIRELDSQTLITKGDDQKSNVYRTYGK